MFTLSIYRSQGGTLAQARLFVTPPCTFKHYGYGPVIDRIAVKFVSHGDSRQSPVGL